MFLTKGDDEELLGRKWAFNCIMQKNTDESSQASCRKKTLKEREEKEVGEGG